MHNKDSKRPRYSLEYLGNTWRKMLERCEDPTSDAFRYYGKRGISVCREWHEFETFKTYILSTLGNKPTPKHSLDRIENDSNYEPGNVRWATAKEQARNTRKNVFIEADGHVRCIAEWAGILNIPAPTIYQRIRKGWTGEEALGFIKKIFKRPLRGRLLTINNDVRNLKGWAKSIGINRTSLAERLDKGLSLAEALSLPKGEKIPKVNRPYRRPANACKQFLTVDGETHNLTFWARQVGLHPQTIASRKKNGWPDREAIFTPKEGKRRKNLHTSKFLTFNGETKHLAAWARQVGITPCSFAKRLRLGWSLEKAITTKPPQTLSTKAA